jgi:hypothetical protein
MHLRHGCSSIRTKEEAMNPDRLIDKYFSVKNAIHAYFGYEGNHREIPMEDLRGMYWMLTNGETRGFCVHSPQTFTLERINNGKTTYGGRIYTQRYLLKWVYRSVHHVMVSVDTGVDGNKFLEIYDADKECTDDELRKAYLNKWSDAHV